MDKNRPKHSQSTLRARRKTAVEGEEKRGAYKPVNIVPAGQVSSVREMLANQIQLFDESRRQTLLP
jgi:hypothetical protein